MKFQMVCLSVAAMLPACSDGGTAPGEDLCMIQTLPLSGELNGPTIIDVELEIQTTGVVATATATDPQGSENLRDVLQTFGLFPDANCVGTPRTLQDDLAGSGVEETFGTIVDATIDAVLYQEIVAAVRWPVQVDFVDADANRTSGRLFARISR